MLDWYLRTHSWNRIALTGLIVAVIGKEIVSTLTLAHLIGLPVGAAVFWMLGWVAITGWRQARLLGAADMAAASGA